ncbi:hypothetical protein [Leifsonia sp. 1010]|uniref:hypothetical protein n=1 Tax=Leifsonia sp. 1010 TaxID=2817769 RepID=UPI002864BC53|nr:hypothetical protein [Leifsonia sp. 1010]MDR6613085.1 hypothetical protein [Leifsonia sp. 1010]
MNALVERYWIPMAGVIPVIALAFVLEIRQQAKRISPENSVGRRVASVYWVVVGIGLVTSEVSALSAMFFDRRNEVAAYIALFAVALGMANVISEPVWALFGALNADLPTVVSQVRGKMRSSAPSFIRRHIEAKWRSGIENDLQRTAELLTRVRASASEAASTMEELQQLREFLARRDQGSVEARNASFFLASASVLELERWRRETFDVFNDVQDLMASTRARADRGPFVVEERPAKRPDLGIELVRNRLTSIE